MGRKRLIDQTLILDAAERVVARDGAAHLTLDAVAREAGVGKATVLYDFKSKQALIEAVVDRAFAADKAHHAALEAEARPDDSPTIRSRIRGAAEAPPEDFRPVALNLSAALILDPGLRAKMQANQAEVIDRILQTSKAPRGALLAYLAVEGLKFLEILDFHRFNDADRSRIITEIEWLAETDPAP
ncbi:TetR/AcrR family transcriptional regulator [Brevundimonas sp. GCM10030266]|uniref:TetR/AcrR family transcriptional regulator n=1 Tax=Brevundimonas sp. GCM10030266 TaxID=3273386 RepID=UPI00360C7E6A